MNDYELMYILHPRLTAQEVEETTQRIAGLITNAGGEIVSVDPWGRRRLAYPIDRNLEGSYVLMTFNAEPSTGPALEAQLNLSEDVLRHLLIRGIIPYDGPPRDERPSDRGMQERPPRSAPAPRRPLRHRTLARQRRPLRHRTLARQRWPLRHRTLARQRWPLRHRTLARQRWPRTSRRPSRWLEVRKRANQFRPNSGRGES